MQQIEEGSKGKRLEKDKSEGTKFIEAEINRFVEVISNIGIIGEVSFSP